MKQNNWHNLNFFFLKKKVLPHNYPDAITLPILLSDVVKKSAFKYLKRKKETTSYLIFNTFVGTEGTKQGLEFYITRYIM